MPGVDEAIVTKMEQALEAAIEDEDYQKNMAAMGAELKLYTGDEYKAFLEDMLEDRLAYWGLEK